MTPVNSSNIKQIGYNPDARTLEVHFHGGAKHRYADVSPEKHAAVMGDGAPDHSVGKAFHKHIIKGDHKSEKID